MAGGTMGMKSLCCHKGLPLGSPRARHSFSTIVVMTRSYRLHTWPSMQRSFHTQPFVHSMGVVISFTMISRKLPTIYEVCGRLSHSDTITPEIEQTREVVPLDG